MSAALGLCAALSTAAQQAPVVIISSGSQLPSAVVREIDDPNTGAHWLLVADHPGGPGRLVLSGTITSIARTENEPLPKPVVRAGDRLLLEEHSDLVDARLEATALSPAVDGGPLRVRLHVGGRIVSAIATGPGRATLSPHPPSPRSEDRP